MNFISGNSTVGTLGGTATVNSGPTINLGASASATAATFSPAGGNNNYVNPINVLGTGTNTIIENGGNSTSQQGTITLNGGNTVTLTLASVNEGNTAGINFGAVAGTGNVIINENNTKLFGTQANQLSAFGNTGTITVNGTGVQANQQLSFTGALSSAVTGLTVNYTTGTFTTVLDVSDPAFTGDTTLTAGKLTIANATALQSSVLNLNSTAGTLAFGGTAIDPAGGGAAANVNITTATIGGLAGNGNLALTNAGSAAGAVALTLGNSNAANGSSTNPNTLAPVYSGVLSGAGSVIKTGSNTQTFTGANTYTGVTTINAGTLALGTGGSLGNTAITVTGSTAVFAPIAGTTVGNTAVAAAGASLSLASSGTLNLADGTIANFTVNQGSSATGSYLTINSGVLKFDIGTSNTAAASPSDELLFSGGTGAVTATGTNLIFVNTATAANLTPGATYTVIAANSGLGTSAFAVSNPNVVIGGALYHFDLSASTATAEVLTVDAGGAAAASAFYTGSQNASLNYQNPTTFQTNFTADAAGTTNTFAVPVGTTNVTFTANSATNLSTTLDGNFAVNSLTFSGTGTSNTAGTTIAQGSGGTLTINASNANGNTAGNGITVNAGSGVNTISAPVTLGASQTFTNNATNALVISGAIGDSSSNFTLTKAGAGPLTLSGNNTYGGGTTLSAGTLNINASGTSTTNSALGTGAFTIAGGTTLDNTSGAAVTLATNNAVSVTAGGNFAAFSAGETSASNLNLGIGATSLNIASAGTETVTLNGTGTTLTFGGAVTAQTNAAGTGTLTVNGAGDTLVLGSLVTNTNTTARAFTIGGTGNTTINGPISGGAAGETLTKAGTGLLTLNGASSFNFNTAIPINSGIVQITNGSGFGAGTVTVTGNNAATVVSTAQLNLPVSGSGVGSSAASPNIVSNVFDLASAQLLGANTSGTPAIPAYPEIENVGGYNRITGAVVINNTGGSGGVITSDASNLELAGQLSSNISGTAGALRTFDFGGVGNGTVSGAIIDESGGNQIVNVRKDGAGTWTLSNANNTYTGGTNINAGILNVSAAKALGTTGAITFGGGTLQYGGNNTQDYSARFSTAAQAYKVDVNSQPVTYATGLTGTGTSTLSVSSTAAGGRLNLTGLSTYTGATTVGANTVLNLASAGTNTGAPSNSSGTYTPGTLAGASGTATTVTVNNSGTLLLTASYALNQNLNVTLNGTGTAATGTGAINLANGVLIGQGANNTGTSMGVTTQGVGMLTLASNATLYYGGTSGTLVFNSFTPNGKMLDIEGSQNFASSSAASGVDGTNDRLIFLTDPNTNGFLADITFAGVPNSATEINLGSGIGFEIVPVAVPEPSTWVAGVLAVLAVVGIRLRRRKDARVI